MGNDPIPAEDAAFIMTKLRTGVLVVLAFCGGRTPLMRRRANGAPAMQPMRERNPGS